MFTLSWNNIKSALVSGVITAVLAVGGYVMGLGDIFKIDIHDLVNVATLSLITTIVSIVKSFLTTSSGSFLGAVEVK